MAFHLLNPLRACASQDQSPALEWRELALENNTAVVKGTTVVANE
jgi:hypothetical protein